MVAAGKKKESREGPTVAELEQNQDCSLYYQHFTCMLAHLRKARISRFGDPIQSGLEKFPEIVFDVHVYETTELGLWSLKVICLLEFEN